MSDLDSELLVPGMIDEMKILLSIIKWIYR